MDLNGIEKIKVNNAIVVFIVIINCLLYPLTVLLAIDYKLFFEYELLKVVSATLCIGCTNFAIIYCYTAILTAFYDNGEDENTINYFFQRPLILSLFCLTAIYTLTILTINEGDLQNSIRMVVLCDAGCFLGQLGGVIIAAIKNKKKSRTEEAT